MWVPCVLSHFSRVQLCTTLWTKAHQTPLSMGFSRQEYWSGLPCPPPGDLPNPGTELTSLMSPALAGVFSNTSATGKTYVGYTYWYFTILESSTGKILSYWLIHLKIITPLHVCISNIFTKSNHDLKKLAWDVYFYNLFNDCPGSYIFYIVVIYCFHWQKIQLYINVCLKKGGLFS